MTDMISPETKMGQVSLTVSNLDRSLAYYQHNIGLKLQERGGDTAVLGANGTPLLRLKELPGSRVIRRATGLYHFALLVPSRLELARTLQHLIETQTPIGGASDHLVSEALYLSDPDGHGIEIYRDRPRSAWYDESGKFLLDTIRFDVDGVMSELKDGADPWLGIDPATIMGHVHLQVADVDAATRFYVDILGFSLMAGIPMASFISAGGYHHHLGMNSWMGAGAPPPPENAARLLSYEILLPDQAALGEVVDRLAEAGIVPEEQADGLAVRDPSQNTAILKTVS
jgi:catechol 2,3-dioxygenase